MAMTTRHRRPSGARVKIVCAVVTGLVMADTLAATLVLPALRRDPLTAQVPLAQLSLLATVNLAAIAGLLATGGRLADLLGRRAVLAAGLALFAAGATAMAFGPSWPMLVAGRAAQGVGAALMLPAGLGLLLASVEPSRRSGAAALWSAATGCGGLLMHTLGGWMLDNHGWRALYLPLAAAAAALLLLGSGLPRSRAARPPRPDLPGMAALVAASTALVLLISLGSTWGWTSSAATGLAAVTVAGFGLAGLRARRHPAGAIDTELWCCPGFPWGLATSLLYGLTAFPVLAVAPLALRELGLGPTEAGLALAPMSAAVVAVSMLTARLARRAGTSWTTYAGAYLSAAALLTLYVVPHASLAALVAVALVGAGFGLISTTAAIAGTAAVPADRYALAVGALTTARMLGGAIGPAAALAYLSATGQQPSQGYPDVLVGAIGVSLLLALLALARHMRRPASAVTPKAASALQPAEPAGDVERLRQTLQRQRARLEAIAAAAETELAALTDPFRSRRTVRDPRSDLPIVFSHRGGPHDGH